MPALVERPKMSLAMWAALKSHIMKQREKKKQEQEADAAVERLRREQEMKRKQDAMTLEEIKDQLCHLEKKLGELKDEKHQLFLQLKRVLNEDETRKRAFIKEPNDVIQVSHHYPTQGMPVGATTNMYMMAGSPLMNRTPVMYKVGAAAQQNVISSGAMKRPRSPSPPPSAYQQGFNYKSHIAAYGQKPVSYANTQNSGYYSHTTATVTGTAAAVVVANSAPYPGYPGPHPSGQYTTQEQAISAKHLPTSYHVPHLQQQGYVGALHQQIEHPSPKAGLQEEKYYVQQTGGISSGYPVRAQPPQTSSHFQPPNSMSVATPSQITCRKDDVLRRNMQNETHR